MPSASGLHYGWRSRAGRSHHDPDLPLQPASFSSSTTAADAHTRHPRRRRQHHRRLTDRDDPARRHVDLQIDPRRLPHPHASMEHGQAWIENQNEAESVPRIISNAGSSGSTLDRLRLAGNDQLPSVVLQARARLQERLRGISLSGSRNEVSLGDDVRAMSPREWGTEISREWFESDQFPSNLIAETDEVVKYVNRPPGLSSEAFHNLQLEVYQDAVEGNNDGRAFVECSICLENFLDGEEMILLTCCHRFHPACLEPWVKSCGDCPYCRTKV